jgi:hypothetical protein
VNTTILLTDVINQMNDLNKRTLEILRKNDKPVPVDLEDVLITPITWRLRDRKMIFPVVEYTYYRNGSIWTLRLERVSGKEAPMWDVDLYGQGLIAKRQPDIDETMRMLEFITSLVKGLPPVS